MTHEIVKIQFIDDAPYFMKTTMNCWVNLSNKGDPERREGG